MKYIKRKIDDEGYIINCFNHDKMLVELNRYKGSLPPKSKKWILDENRYKTYHTKTLKDFYLYKIAISKNKAVATFADDVYIETFIYHNLFRYINRPIEARQRTSNSEVSRVLMDEIAYDTQKKLITHAIRLRNGELYFKCQDIEYKRDKRHKK
ncbi:MAG: hypothetical protein CSA42_07960 [Gammaproteobacteria bacterium]|nr:MAG: hypothetical protein CSA42_07960 [Gammaproteobacteria bacterium]